MTDQALLMRRIMAKSDPDSMKPTFAVLWICGAMCGYAFGALWMGYLLTNRYESREAQYRKTIDQLKAPKDNKFNVRYL